jgi:hypothetical protein
MTAIEKAAQKRVRAKLTFVAISCTVAAAMVVYFLCN